jgi:hypothetical protein
MARNPVKAVRTALLAIACTGIGLYALAAIGFLAMLWTLFQVLMLFFG